MLLQPQKAKLASMIISRGKPDFVQKLGEESSTEKIAEMPKEEETDATVALESAAQKMISAFESKDPKAVVSVIKDMFAILQAEEPEFD